MVARFFTLFRTQNLHSELYFSTGGIQEVVLHIALRILGTILSLFTGPL